jgi:hypothetical protein
MEFQLRPWANNGSKTTVMLETTTVLPNQRFDAIV